MEGRRGWFAVEIPFLSNFVSWVYLRLYLYGYRIVWLGGWWVVPPPPPPPPRPSLPTHMPCTRRHAHSHPHAPWPSRHTLVHAFQLGAAECGAHAVGTGLVRWPAAQASIAQARRPLFTAQRALPTLSPHFPSTLSSRARAPHTLSVKRFTRRLRLRQSWMNFPRRPGARTLAATRPRGSRATVRSTSSRTSARCRRTFACRATGRCARS